MKFNRINSLTLSICGHIILALLLYYGVPVNVLPAPQGPPIIVDMVNISDLTNIIAKHKAKKKTDIDKKSEKKSSKEVKAAEEVKSDPALEAKPAEVVPEAKPQAEPEAVPIPNPEEFKEVVKSNSEKLKETPEAKKPKLEPKKAVKKSAKKSDPFADPAFLKTLEEATKKSEKQEAEERELKDALQDLETDSIMPYNDELPLSVSEEDALKAQLYEYWNIAAFNQRMKVAMLITYDGEGNVINIKPILERGQPAQYAAFVASAERAVKMASPLRLSAERLSRGRDDFEFIFDNNERIQSVKAP